MMMKRSLLFSAALVTLLAGGCKHKPVATKALDSLSGMKAATESRLATAAHTAMAEGKTKEALAYYARLYDDGPRNDDTKLNYAQLLRRSGEAEKARDILDGEDAPALRNEYAAASLETGHYDDALKAIDSVLKDEDAAAFHADAQNLLGLVLDTEGKHKEAEAAYTTALKGWKGDPSSVLNNLGLCLAAQGRLDDGLRTLREALIRNPQRSEIARNIEMVEALRKSLLPAAPLK